jgi:hypothetical protein
MGSFEERMAQYARTIIKIDGPASQAIVLGPGEAVPPELAELLPLYVISAWNPGSKRLADDPNASANALLRERIEGLGGAPILHAAGHDPDPGANYHEDGFAVAGISQEQAVTLDRQFSQDAIFEITAPGHRVVPCFDV